MCTLGHDCLGALPHTDQYRFYSWPLALEAGDSLTLSQLLQQSVLSAGFFPLSSHRPPGHRGDAVISPSGTEGAAAESVASFKKRDSFGGDHSGDSLCAPRDQPSPQRTHILPHIRAHLLLFRLLQIPSPSATLPGEALDLPLPVILHGREVQPNVLAVPAGQSKHTCKCTETRIAPRAAASCENNVLGDIRGRVSAQESQNVIKCCPCRDFY